MGLAPHRRLTVQYRPPRRSLTPTLLPRPAGPPAAEVRPSSGGIGRSTSNAAGAVSDALRRQDGPHLRARRRVALLHMVSNAALSVVGLYQFGLLKHVPEPPLPGLGADAVDAAGEAYQLGHTPDSTLGIVSGGISLALAGMGGPQRVSEHPLIPLAMFGKALLDATNGAYLFARTCTPSRLTRRPWRPRAFWPATASRPSARTETTYDAPEHAGGQAALSHAPMSRASSPSPRGGCSRRARAAAVLMSVQSRLRAPRMTPL